MFLPDSSSHPALPHSHRKPILCCVTDRHSLSGALKSDLFEPLLEKIEELAAAGVDWIQLREKDLSGRATAALACEAMRRVSKRLLSSGILPRILVNDRVDVALSERAGGIHLGENSLPVEEVKRLLTLQFVPQRSHDFLVGVSCHSLDAVRSAASAGADYVFFGPVFATPSKASCGPPHGLARLADVCHSIEIPVLAIGGITLENASSCLSAGACGIAAIRLFQDSTDPAGLVRSLRQSFS